MRGTIRSVVALAVIVSATTSIVTQAEVASALTYRERAARAIGYIKNHQRASGAVPDHINTTISSTAAAILATVAAGTGRDVERDAIVFLRDRVAAGGVTDVGLESRVALAVAAAGKDPHSFGGHDLIAEISAAEQVSGQFGTGTMSDDALAMLAIEAAGESPSANSITWLVAAQCPDGGWAYDDPYDSVNDDSHCHNPADGPFLQQSSEADTTSYVVQALEASGTTSFAVSPFAFFRTLRDAGGWSRLPESAYLVMNAISTALVIQAYVSAGRTVPRSARTALRALQYSCGAFAYAWNGSKRGAPDLASTILVVPGLMKKAMPFTGSVVGAAPSVRSC